jgi:hypothetical protein
MPTSATASQTPFSLKGLMIVVIIESPAISEI